MTGLHFQLCLGQGKKESPRASVDSYAASSSWSDGAIYRKLLLEINIYQKVQLHTQPCLEFEVRQERRGGKDHGV